MAKLFSWSVDHVFRKQNTVIRRNEHGIVRAQNSDEARALLLKSVCTILSENLTVVEIPDKMVIYSFGHKDTVEHGPD